MFFSLICLLVYLFSSKKLLLLLVAKVRINGKWKIQLHLQEAVPNTMIWHVVLNHPNVNVVHLSSHPENAQWINEKKRKKQTHIVFFRFVDLIDFYLIGWRRRLQFLIQFNFYRSFVFEKIRSFFMWFKIFWKVRKNFFKFFLIFLFMF